MVHGKEISVPTKGFSDARDLTAEAAAAVRESGVKSGLVAVTVIGSTASVTTIEFEPALAEDLRDKLEELVSRRWQSRHSQTWGDDNGFSHIRASLMGPGVCLPVREGRIVLGSWQQIVLVDHDNRPRDRRVFIQVIGE